MTEELLHPGLESGADLLTAEDVESSILFACGTFIDYGITAASLNRKIRERLAALSLSSPIEPHSPNSQAIIEKWLIAYQAGEAKAGDCKSILDTLRAQASSEVREARVAAFNEAIDAINGVRFAFERSGWADALERVIKLRNAALAPSRQGAAKRVES